MPQQIEIALALKIVLPLLELLHEEVDAIAPDLGQLINGCPLTEDSLSDADFLLNQFTPAFRRTGTIRISEYAAPAIIRACALLRLQLRQGRLSALPDEKLQENLDADRHHGAEKQAVMAYVFLGTIQEIILQNFRPTLALSDAARNSAAPGWLNQFLKFCRLLPSTPPAVAERPGTWRVVVLDDPVNSMSYVTVVFQRVLGLPEETARHRMQEVHTLKRSSVWEGSEAAAQTRVQTLQTWHLNTVLEAAPPTNGANTQ